MDNSVCCPVCTLYLREGVTLQSHLQTHPKDQVIQALVKLSNANDFDSVSVNEDGSITEEDIENSNSEIAVDCVSDTDTISTNEDNCSHETQPVPETVQESCTENAIADQSAVVDMQYGAVAYAQFIQGIDGSVVPQYVTIPAVLSSDQDNSQSSVVQIVYNQPYIIQPGPEMLNSVSQQQHYMSTYCNPAFFEARHPYLENIPVHYATVPLLPTHIIPNIIPIEHHTIPVTEVPEEYSVDQSQLELSTNDSGNNLLSNDTSAPLAENLDPRREIQAVQCDILNERLSDVEENLELESTVIHNSELELSAAHNSEVFSDSQDGEPEQHTSVVQTVEINRNIGSTNLDLAIKSTKRKLTSAHNTEIDNKLHIANNTDSKCSVSSNIKLQPTVTSSDLLSFAPQDTQLEMSNDICTELNYFQNKMRLKLNQSKKSDKNILQSMDSKVNVATDLEQNTSQSTILKFNLKPSGTHNFEQEMNAEVSDAESTQSEDTLTRAELDIDSKLDISSDDTESVQLNDNVKTEIDPLQNIVSEVTDIKSTESKLIFAKNTELELNRDYIAVPEASNLQNSEPEITEPQNMELSVMAVIDSQIPNSGSNTHQNIKLKINPMQSSVLKNNLGRKKVTQSIDLEQSKKQSTKVKLDSELKTSNCNGTNVEPITSPSKSKSQAACNVRSGLSTDTEFKIFEDIRNSESTSVINNCETNLEDNYCEEVSKQIHAENKLIENVLSTSNGCISKEHNDKIDIVKDCSGSENYAIDVPTVEVSSTCDLITLAEQETLGETYEITVNSTDTDNVESVSGVKSSRTTDTVQDKESSDVNVIYFDPAHINVIEIDNIQILVPRDFLVKNGAYLQYSADDDENLSEVVVANTSEDQISSLIQPENRPLSNENYAADDMSKGYSMEYETLSRPNQNVNKEEEKCSTSYDLLARESWDASDGSDFEINAHNSPVPSPSLQGKIEESTNFLKLEDSVEILEVKLAKGKKKKLKIPRIYSCWTCGISFNCPKERRVHQTVHRPVVKNATDDNEVTVVKGKLVEDKEIKKLPKSEIHKLSEHEALRKTHDKLKKPRLVRKKVKKNNNVKTEEKKETKVSLKSEETAAFEQVFVVSLDANITEDQKAEEKPVNEINSHRDVKETNEADSKSFNLEKTKICIKSFCNKCHEEFPTRKELLEHMLISHKVSKETKFMCPTCKVCFANESSLNLHFKVHPLECISCGKLFYKQQNLTLHLKRHLGIKPFVCAICTKSFVTKQKLSEHYNIHTGETPLKCNLCPESFRRYSNLIQHKNRHHLKLKKKVKDFLCHCGEVFHSKKKLAWHMEIHEEKPKSCTFCSEKFVHESSLTRHIRKAHDKKYLRKGSKNVENVECPTCGVLYLKSSLVVHMRSHTGARPFQCNRCGKEFSTKWNLQLHEWTHANRNTKPFKCTLCKCAFFRESEYQSHLHSHRNVRPYTCNYCGSQFIRKYNCLRHMREHETNKSYACNVCGKTFHRSYYLKEHLRVHTSDRPFVCHICGKASTTKSNHNKHVKIHHAREPVNTEG